MEVIGMHHDPDLDLLNTLAMLLEESGDKNHAMEFYERISKLDENDKKSLQKLASAKTENFKEKPYE